MRAQIPESKGQFNAHLSDWLLRPFPKLGSDCYHQGMDGTMTLRPDSGTKPIAGSA